MSVRFLAFLARRLEAWRLLLVVSVRDEELDEASDLGRTLDDLMKGGQLAALRLGPLTRSDTLALVRALVDDRDGTRDPVRLVKRCGRRARDTPCWCSRRSGPWTRTRWRRRRSANAAADPSPDDGRRLASSVSAPGAWWPSPRWPAGLRLPPARPRDRPR